MAQLVDLGLLIKKLCITEVLVHVGDDKDLVVVILLC